MRISFLSICTVSSSVMVIVRFVLCSMSTIGRNTHLQLGICTNFSWNATNSLPNLVSKLFEILFDRFLCMWLVFLPLVAIVHANNNNYTGKVKYLKNCDLRYFLYVDSEYASKFRHWEYLVNIRCQILVSIYKLIA